MSAIFAVILTYVVIVLTLIAIGAAFCIIGLVLLAAAIVADLADSREP